MQPKRRSHHGRGVRPAAPVAVVPPETGARPAVSDSDQNVSRTRKWSPIGLLLLAIAAVCNIGSPWQLGWYLDDWPTYAEAVRFGAPFSGQRLTFFIDIDRSRPGLAAVRWVFSSGLGDSVFGWHVAMLLVNVAIVFALYRLIRVLDGRISPGLAAGIAAVWLVQPWLAANRFWMIMFPINLAVVLFAYLCVWAIRAWESGKGPWIAPGLAYLACCLSYEAFYLQFVPLLIIGAALVLANRAKRAHVATTAAALAVAQASAMVFKFFGPHTAGMVRNPRMDYARQFDSATYFVGTFTQSFSELAAPIGIVAAAMVVVAAAALWLGRSQTPRDNRTPALILVACFSGAAICIAGYLVGGVQLNTIGTDSRVALFLGFWAAPAVAVCTAEVQGRGRPRLATVAGVLGVGLVLLLGASLWMREQDWAKAWSKQREFLSRVPAAQMARVPSDAVILYVGPQSVYGAPVFLQSWDINSAVPLAYPALRNRPLQVYNKWRGMLVWDGAELKSEAGQVYATGRGLYVWQPEQAVFRRVPKSTTINSDYSVTLPPFPGLWEQP